MQSYKPLSLRPTMGRKEFQLPTGALASNDTLLLLTLISLWGSSWPLLFYEVMQAHGRTFTISMHRKRLKPLSKNGTISRRQYSVSNHVCRIYITGHLWTKGLCRPGFKICRCSCGPYRFVSVLKVFLVMVCLCQVTGNYWVLLSWNHPIFW